MSLQPHLTAILTPSEHSHWPLVSNSRRWSIQPCTICCVPQHTLRSCHMACMRYGVWWPWDMIACKNHLNQENYPTLKQRPTKSPGMLLSRASRPKPTYWASKIAVLCRESFPSWKQENGIEPNTSCLVGLIPFHKSLSIFSGWKPELEPRLPDRDYQIRTFVYLPTHSYSFKNYNIIYWFTRFGSTLDWAFWPNQCLATSWQVLAW